MTFKTTKELCNLNCLPCNGSTVRFSNTEIEDYILALGSRWSVEETANATSKLRATIKTKDFMEGLRIVNILASIAEQQGHHFDVELRWGKLIIRITTHAIKGLSENDFILAAKIDEALVE